MKNTKNNLMFLIPVIPLAIFIVNYLMINFPSITFYNCLLLTASLGTVIFLLTFIVCLNLGNMAKAFYLKVRGYSCFPLYIYPLYVYRSIEGKIRLKIVFEWTTCFRNLFSYDLIMQYHSAPIETETICTNAIRIKLYAKMVALAVIGSFNYYLLSDVFVLIFYIAFALMFYWIANINTDYFHGEITQVRNIKRGALVLYLAKEVCIYEFAYSEKRKIYDKFEEWMVKNKCFSDNKNLVASVLKHMCIEGYYFKKYSLSSETIRIMKENILSNKEIQFGMFDETWELAKVYLAYSLLCQEACEVSYIAEELRYIRTEMSFYSSRFSEMINWYSRIANCKLTENEKYRYPLFSRKDRFCIIAPTYKKVSEEIENRLLSIATAH